MSLQRRFTRREARRIAHGLSPAPEYGAEEWHFAPVPEHQHQEIRPTGAAEWRNPVMPSVSHGAYPAHSTATKFHVHHAGPHHGQGPKGYRRSDERIHEDVCDELTEAPELDAREIEVSVENGEVTLKGMVPGRAPKVVAEMIAEEIPGVIDVHNQIRIKR